MLSAEFAQDRNVHYLRDVMDFWQARSSVHDRTGVSG
jgi:hypothetical protein